MSDLIVSINVDESRKHNKILIETYEGSIPKLKSKKFSGQLRAVNINAEKTYDNIDFFQFKSIQNLLDDSLNIQINKYQFLVSFDCIVKLADLLDTQCFFYQYKKIGMYLIEHISLNKIPNNSKLYFESEEIICGGQKTTIYFITKNTISTPIIENIRPNAYINILENDYPLKLLFEYDSFIVDFTNNEKNLANGAFRNYGFEERVKKKIIDAGWSYKKSVGFIYIGSNIRVDIEKLIQSGINVFTNQNKKLSSVDFSSIRVSYDIDWFSIKGNAVIDDQDVDIETLLQLRSRGSSWIEYNNSVIFLPKSLLSKSIKVDKNDNIAKLDKKQISSAIITAHDTNNSVVRNLDSLMNYENVPYDINATLQRTLRPYQVIGVKWLLSLKHNSFGACLADDMGLGKTLQIIAFLSDKTTKNAHNLVIAPKTLIINWQREIERFAPEMSVYLYHGIDRDISLIEKTKVVISTYQTILNDISLFTKINFDNLIIDEAQNIKNANSKTYKAIKSISANMKITLTGTPIENNVNEFLGLMKLINPDLILDKYVKSSNSEENAISRIRLMTSPFLLRRMKKDVLTDLPKKQEQMLCVKMDENQRRIYDKVLNNLRYEIQRMPDRFEIKNNSVMLKGLLLLQEICCHPQLVDNNINEGCKESVKFDLLIELLQSLYSNAHKVVVFSRFTRMLKIIEKGIAALHLNYYYLDGKTQDRIAVVDEFERSNNGVFLISLKAGGTGLNLTSADAAIIYDPWWNPAAEKQAEDRIYRIGQTQNVMIYRLIIEDSVEEKVQELQKKKTELSTQLLDGHEMPLHIDSDMMRKLIMN